MKAALLNIFCSGLILILGPPTAGSASSAPPLTTLEYRITGTQLRVTPPVLSVPKAVPGSILVELVSGGSTNSAAAASLAAGAFVEATLRGPAFPARKVIGQVNAPLILPLLPLVGDYELNDIKLVDALTGATRIEGSPNRVPIHVFDEVLISRVTSRPLTLDEIRDRGIAIDESNFRAVEFEVGFVLDGRTIPVRFPVVAPTFRQSTEIIPAAELEKMLVEANEINRQIAFDVALPRELETARVNIDIQGINFQPVEETDQDLALQIPPIPALMVVPGRIGFLNQFFSVQIFTENGAPPASVLSVANIQATLRLPPGPDQIPGPNYTEPGDDPLRFARVGPDKIIQPTQTVVRPGADGRIGTSDDIARLFPRESGQGEFLVEGLQEGLHVMDLDLVADLEGLAAGIVKVKGKAAGSVLVRNPKFSMAFSHPRTVRFGEVYDAFVTILNTGSTPANLVQVSLSSGSISGGVLESDETVELGTILPGQTATARFRVRSQRTGAVTFSNLTTGDDSVVGRFRLRMGIDERGVALSPDTLLMPDFVNGLPTNAVNVRTVLDAAHRVLGQALSVATAGQLPSAVKNVPRSFITAKVLELAEAGQRIRYHDPTNRVLADLLLDWQGGRNFDAGFDQILRETDAGREWREAVMSAFEFHDALNATERLAQRAADFAGRGEAWLLASVSDASLDLSLRRDGVVAALDRSDVPKALVYRGARGHWLAASPAPSDVIEWRSTNNVSQAVLSVVQLDTNGTGRRVEWTLSALPADACLRFFAGAGNALLQVDENCDGLAETTLAGTIEDLTELAPTVVAVVQDITVHAGRPIRPCSPQVPGLPPNNYGTVVAVLFSKPMTQERANVPSAYSFDNGNTAGSVQIQPGGRVALLNMRLPVGAIVPRVMTVSGVTDPRGHAVVNGTKTNESNVRNGVAIRGRVARADASPAGGVPVTLTYYDLQSTGFGECPTFIVRVSQVFTDENGYFDFDFVLAGIPYSISATDTGGLPPEAIQLIVEAAGDDRLQAEKLLQLANSPGVQNTLLEAFAVNVLPQAIAKAEGLDRALLRDMVPMGSPREGSTVPVALRFRGRGVVTGRVVLADGTTPALQTAINLFPDPDSRELGRGVFSDENGRFAFFGVPLGVFTVQAQSPTGLFRTISDTIDVVGETNDITIVLSTNQVILTELRGRVTEADGLTPHARAQVFVGQFVEGRFENVVAAATADADGFWTALNVPVGTYDLVAISLDGKRKGERRDIAAVAGSPTYVNIALQGRATVIGRVETSTGQPIENAIVGGGEALVRTDANGFFTLHGVPTGRRTINAGVERTTNSFNPKSNPAFEFPRLGSADVEVLPGVDNFAVIRLTPVGRIVGRVLDAAGNPVPRTKVALPEQNGFSWVQADDSGNYRFENLALEKYNLSAPAPATADNDVSGILRTLANRGSSEGEIQAAIGEAFAIFTGAADPFLNGEGATFNPLTWGFTEATLSFDGQTAVADIRFLREGTISGTVLNGQGVPIGARVRLTGIGPLPNGRPGFIVRGERNSDPALGTFEFPGQAFAGDWGLQAASPFFSVVISESGRTSSTDPNETNVVLQFPAVREQNGRLAGRVFYPDGPPVGEGVRVRITARDGQATTETDGTYELGGATGLPALTSDGRPGVGYQIEADDPVTGLRGVGSAIVLPGITNVLNVRLLGKGALAVTVLNADGTPVSGASVELEQGTYPHDRFAGTNDASGVILFQNIFEGHYAISAQVLSGPTRIFGRAAASVAPGQTNHITLRLGPTASIRGRFVKRDLLTPVPFAQVAVGSVGFTTTDTNGTFFVGGLPLGTYRLLSQDPVSGIGASVNVTLSVNGQTNDVLLVEQSRGEVRGFVVNSLGTGFLPGAHVTISFADGLTPSRTVTTGPDGGFNFPGTPAGAFSLHAEDPITGRAGNNSGVLPENAALFQIDVPLQPVAALLVQVFSPGTNNIPADATVAIEGAGLSTGGDTDSQGRLLVGDLPLGTYAVEARSRGLDESRSLVVTNVVLANVGSTNSLEMRLPGVGGISGTVLLSDGVTRAIGATVVLTLESTLFRNDTENTLTDAAGRFNFTNVAIGPYRLTAQAAALGVSFNGSIASNRELDEVTLTLGASGTVQGRLVRANGATPMPDVDLLLTFASQSGLPGRAVARTGPGGLFTLSNIPVGSFNLEAIATSIAGIARLASALSSNGQVLNLGDVRLDEDDPRVVSVSPAHTAVLIPITTPVELTFNERLATNSLDPNGIYLRLSASTSNVPANLDLLPHPTNSALSLVRIRPIAPLQSEKTYEVIVIDGERRNALGSVIGRGPTDLIGRPLVAPFISSFTTADNDPPVLLSIFPTNNAIQIDPRAVIRLAFNEPIRDTNYFISLVGPNGPVAGTNSVGLNRLVLTFASHAQLDVNTTYTLTASNVFDLAGNRATNQPFVVTFATLDTLGPRIATLRIADGRAPVAGSTVPIEAILQTNEIGALVEFTQDFNLIGRDTNFPYRASVVLPAVDSTIIRAQGFDRFGNSGTNETLVIDVVSNQPPVLTLARSTPLSGALSNGQPFSVVVSATDDVAISNLSVIGFGALPFSTNLSNGSQRTLNFVVPSNAPPGVSVQLRAQATDALGIKSSEAVLDFEIVDRTPPTLAILSPADNALVNPAQTLELIVASSDNGTNHLLEVVLSGGVNATQTLSMALAPNVSVTNTFAFSLAGAPSDGSIVTATVRATDSATNASALARSFRLPDIRPPQLLSVTPTNGSVRQSLWPSPVVFNFDESLEAGSVSNSVVVTNGAGLATPFTAALANTNRQLRLTLPRPLRPGVAYTNILLPTLTDTSSNRWRNLGGIPVPAEGAAFVFTTAAVFGTVPTNGTRVIAGQLVQVTANYELGLGASSFRFQFASNAPVQVSAGSNATVAVISVPTNATTGLGTISITASPDASFNEAFAFAPVILDIRPFAGDEDADGMPNSFEIVNNLNPFANDAGQDPDSDGLSNQGEFQAGTNPHNPDTDGDGLPDGSDPSPLVPDDAVTPVELTFNIAGIADFQSVNQNYGDRVTSNTMGAFSYGGLNPFAPNVTASYGTLLPVLWTTDYGSLTNVLFEDQDHTGVLTVTLTGDFGVGVRLHRFDLAAFAPVFGSDPSVTAVEVLNGDGQTMFVTNNAAISRTTFTRFEFTPALSGNRLTIRVDARNLGGLNDDIGIDNIRFSQQGNPLCLPLPPNAISLWRAETNALDSVSTNHGVLKEGASFAAGKAGQAFNMDGADDYVDIGPLAAIDNASELTVAAWVKRSEANGEFAGVVGKWDTTGPDRTNTFLLYNGEGSFVNRGGFALEFANGQVASAFGTTLMAQNQWYHLAATWRSSDGQLAFFKNGVQEAVGNAGAGQLLRSHRNYTAKIGEWGVLRDVLYKWPGLIDEAVVFNRALSSSEIAAIVAADSTGMCPPGANPDTDSDGMPDLFEFTHGFDPRVNDSSLDADSDGLTNLSEFQRGTAPRDPDSDNDGLNDGPEVALGTNPLNPDTDGDGLSDGVDPNPLLVNQQIAFSGTTNITVIEGATTNLVINAAAPDGPLTLFDYSPTNRPPAFASFVSRTFANTTTNGTVNAVVELNPLHDAAGTHTLTFRAASANGGSGVVNVTVTVVNNPALVPTRWANPVDGAWTDASKWTDGLPGPGKVAVIDAAGTYVVSLDTAVTAAGIVLAHTNALLRLAVNSTLDAPFEIRSGSLEIDASRTLTINRPLVNQGVMRMISANNTFILQGNGRVENEGLWQIFKDPAGFCVCESQVRVPVNVPVGGKLLLNTNTFLVFAAPSSLTVAGELEIQNGSQLRVDSSTPARDLTLAATSSLAGTGTIFLEGSCRLVAPGDLDSTVQIVMANTSELVVPGVYTVRSSRSMSGTVTSAGVVVASNAVLAVSGASFSGPVTVQNGATLQVSSGSATFATNVLLQAGGRLEIGPNSPTLNLHGVLTNRGTIRGISANNTFNFQGSGRVENEGLWEFFKDPAGFCVCESQVRVPVNVPVGGKLLLNTNTFALFTAPSSLTVAGELEIQSGARLRVDGSNPARDLTLTATGSLTGTGTILLEGSSRLVVAGDLDTAVQIAMANTSQLIVPGVYTMRSSRFMSGTVNSGAVVITSNTVFTVADASFSGPVAVQNGATLQVSSGSATFATNVLLQAGGRLEIGPNSPTLNLHGVLTNRGTIRGISANNTFNLQGNGRVENEGLWEIFKDPAGFCVCESQVRVPVNVPVGGKLLLNTNTFVLFTAPSSLTVAGELEIQAGARLRVDGSNPARDLTLTATSSLTGTGTILLEGSCRLIAPGDLDSTVQIAMSNTSQLVVPGVYTIRSSRSMNGTVNSGAVVITSNAVFTVADASFSGPVTVQNGATLQVSSGSATFATNLLVQAGGRLEVGPGSPTLNLHGVLTNRGTIRGISANNVFNLQGNGRVENEGLFEVFADPAHFCVCESQVRVPVNVPAGGKLLLNTNTFLLFTAPSSLTVAGELEIQAGSRLRVDGSTPPRDLTLTATSSLAGTGTILLEGSCRLIASGDLDSTVQIAMSNTAELVVPGVYTVRSSRPLSGTVNSAMVVVATNAVFSVASASFSGPVTVQAGGTLQTSSGTVTFATNLLVQAGGLLEFGAGSPTLNLHGVLTNRGTIRGISANNVFSLQGNGRVENEGLWEIFKDPAGLCVCESSVRLPVNVPVGGKLLLHTNTFLLFTAPSSLTLAGELEIQNGSRLRLDATTPARDLTLASGSVLFGTGTVLLEGANRVALLGDIIWNIGLLDMTGSSGFTGPFLTTIGPGATIRFDHNSTIPGSLTVNGTLTLTSASVTLDITGTLTLNPTGIVNNPGTLRVGAFVNNGGTIGPNPPVLNAAGFASVEISRIELLRSQQGLRAQPETLVSWRGPGEQSYTIETSADLRGWKDQPATIVEVAPGQYQGTFLLSNKAHQFFRVRWNSRDVAEPGVNQFHGPR